MTMGKVETDVAIIGGGCLGTAVARELSRYQADVTLLEKEVDVGFGISKANFGLVRQGGDCIEYRPEYHRSKLLWDSIPMMEPLCKDLEVPFRPVGALALYHNRKEMAIFAKQQSKMNKLKMPNELWDRDMLHRMEPNITKDAIGALYDPVPAAIDPVKFTTALAENAKQNGVNIMLSTEVLDILPEKEEFELKTNNGVIKSRFIVNAAGMFVDKVAAMVKADDFVLYPVRSFVGVLDKKVGKLISHWIYSLPPMPGEMNVIAPMPDREILFGVQMVLSKRDDFSVTKEMADAALRNAQLLIPDISPNDIITYFTGFLMVRNWELGWHEAVVEASTKVPRFINLSIGYPGISAAPAASQEVVELLAKEGLKLVEKSDFRPNRKAISDFSELSDEERNQLITQNSQYGHIVCRCEHVAEGEVVEAIKRGASTSDGVKFRTRAGMGRCQGSFCGPLVTQILAREFNIPEEQVTKKGHESRQLLHKSKQLLKRS